MVRLGLVLTGLTVSLLLIEAGVRVFGRATATPYTGRGLYQPDDELGYVLGPDRDRGEVRTNHWGFRDREYPVEKPAGGYRIVGAGDSFTFGSTDPRGIYLKVLESRLAAGGRPFPVEVINTGVPGYSTIQEWGHLRRFGLSFHPDLVILGLFPSGDVLENEGDIHVDVVDGELSTRVVGRGERWLRRWYLYRFVHGRFTGQAAAAPGPALPEPAYLEMEARRLEVCRRTPPSRVTRGYDVTEKLLVDMRDGLRARGMAFLVLLIPDEFQVDPRILAQAIVHAGRPVEDYDVDLPTRRLKAFLRDHQIEVVDPLPELRARARSEPVYWRQDTHWNEIGHSIAAQALERAIAPKLDLHR
jgi:hypothetical protein